MDALNGRKLWLRFGKDAFWVVFLYNWCIYLITFMSIDGIWRPIKYFWTKLLMLRKNIKLFKGVFIYRKTIYFLFRTQNYNTLFKHFVEVQIIKIYSISTNILPIINRTLIQLISYVIVIILV